MKNVPNNPKNKPLRGKPRGSLLISNYFEMVLKNAD